MAEGSGQTQTIELNPPSAAQISKRKPDSPSLDGSDDPRRTSKIPRFDQDQNPNPSHEPSAENGEKKKLVIDEGKGKMIVQEEEKKPDQNLGHSTGVFVDMGKGKMIVQEEEAELDQNPNPSSRVFVDKGKGKMIVQEEEAELDQNPNPSSRVFVDKGKGKMIVEEEEDSSDDSDEACAASRSDSDYSDDPLMEVDLNNILPSRTRRWAPPVPGAYLVPDQDDDDDDDDDDVDVGGDGDDVDDDDSDDGESE